MALVRSLADKSVDGAILMSSTMSDELVLELAHQQIPVVVLDWQLTVLDGVIGTIAVDFETGIRAAARHLVELGHRRLAHVSGPLNLRTSHARRDAFLAGVAESGVNPDTVRVIEGNLHIDGGRDALEALLATPEPPTAIFAANDLMALGILWAAREHDLRVPENLSIIGLDDIELASEVSPPLSSVALPRFEIGTLAMQMLLDLISSGREPQSEDLQHAVVGSNFVIRKSTAPPYNG
jgi:DNA-binding LacI/PurR family transcriptional regulator